MQSSGLNSLKQLLLEEEHQQYRELLDKMKDVEVKIEETIEAQKKPNVEVGELMEQMIKVMPDKLGPTITQTLKKQIKESRDDVVQALFPIIGQMIKKYVQQEMRILSERLDQQFDQMFSMEHMMLRFKSIFTGAKYSDLVLRQTQEAQVQEIFVIEEGSGVLMGSYSRQGALSDQDMIAGMLTAIKAFVEDAFEQKDQSLEMISYDEYNIYVQNFNKFYIAVVLSGILDASFKSKLNDTILAFVKDMTMRSSDPDVKELTKKISRYFSKL